MAAKWNDAPLVSNISQPFTRILFYKPLYLCQDHIMRLAPGSVKSAIATCCRQPLDLHLNMNLSGNEDTMQTWL